MKVVDELIEERLASIGQRYTSGRKRLVQTIADAGRPQEVVEIAAKSQVAQSSIYRNMVVLEEAGVVHRVTGHDDSARYELSDEFGDHHHHAVCRNCGHVVDVQLSDELETLLGKASRSVQRSSGFVVEDHRLDVVGLCATCVKRLGRK